MNYSKSKKTTKTRKCLDDFFSLREEITALSVVKCRMFHERVIRAEGSLLPIVLWYSKDSYQRVGLCSPEIRAQRLGCSHTTARIKLERAISELEKFDEVIRAPGSAFRKELSCLDNEIHLLDHRKGEAEKTVARIVEELNGAAEATGKVERLRQAEENVREMERLHDDYVDRLGELKDKVVTEMDKLLVCFF